MALMFEFREIENKSEYSPSLISKNAPFTQAWFFGEWQEMVGRKVRRFKIIENSETIGFFQMIKYPLPFGQSFLYIPHAPVLRNFSEGGAPLSDFLKKFQKKLIEIGGKENSIFARFDPYSHNPNYGSEENFRKYFHKVPNYSYHSSYFQPKYEWILNLEKMEDEILSAMHSKTRYGIRLAENRGVKVEIIKSDFQKYFSDFLDLMQKTAERNKFSLHQEVYYKNIFRNCEENKNAFLAIANYNDKILAINLVLFYGETIYFIFGASSDDFKNLMAPHLLHWKIIIEAKKIGYKIYNLGAVGDEFEGVSRFKKRFGGSLLEYSDSYDLVLKPLWYWLYNLRKKLIYLISN